MKIATLLKLSITIFALVLSFVSFAQQGAMRPAGGPGGGAAAKQGKITGTVLDKVTGKPVEYANIAIYRIKDSSVVTGGITNDQGKFSVEKIPYGVYNIKVRFIGYSTSVVNGVKVAQPATEIGKIDLSPSSQNIQEVTVTGRKSEVQNNLDKKVYNIDRTMYGTGGTAIDIMQSLPAVQVDFDGNVSMRGSSVTILIDGRPSNLVSLDQMPAHLIERVEVISNPSAKYDPEGVSGIINIVLKKNRQHGLNGMVNLNAGWNNKYMGSLALNYRKNKINYFVNYTLRSFEGDSYQNSWRQTTGGVNDTYRAEESSGPGKFRMQNIQAGFDIFFNDRNTLNTAFTLEPRKMSGGENASGYIETITPTDRYKTYDFTRNTWSENRNKGGFEYELNYKHAFEKEGHEITAEVNVDRGNMESEQGSIQRYNMLVPQSRPLPEYSYLITNTTNDNIRSFFRTDYVLPLDEKGRLELGYMITLSNSNMTNEQSKSFVEGGTPELIPGDNDDFKYRMLVNSLYFNYGVSFGKFKAQLGVRAENADMHGEQKTEAPFNKSYLDLFPSAFVKYAPNEKNEFGVNYSRRTNRPRMWYLNPFENRTDTLNITRGNPQLDPEYVNSFEVGYTRMFGKKNSISITGFYRKTTGVITPISVQISPLQSYTTYVNLNSSETYGGEAALNVGLFKWWNVNANYSYFHVKLTDKSDSVLSSNAKESDSWTLRATSSWFITKKLTAQLMYNYRSPVVSVGSGGRHGGGGTQGKTQANYYFDGGLRYSIFKGKGDISLRVSDIFNTNKYIFDGFGAGYISYKKSWRDTPNIFVGFSYRINDFKRKPQREDNGDSMDEMM